MALSILFLGTQITVGGAQKLLLSQAQWFHSKGYSVTTAFFYDKDDLGSQWDAENPFPVVDLGAWKHQKHPVANLLLLFRGLVRLWKLLRERKIDVIETYTPDSNILGLLAARLAGVSVRVASHHGYIEGAPSIASKIHGWMINNDFAHRLVTVSQRVRRVAMEEEAIRPEKISVILNGIVPVTLEGSPSTVRKQIHDEFGVRLDGYLMLSVGRVTVQKGHTYLLDAIPAVLNAFPDTVFIIAGDGHLRETLYEESVQLGIDGSTHFLGTRSDIPELLYAADVFVMPSLWEGLPLALLEAMSAGLPVVATKVEGVESIIVDGENGYMISPQDVDALSAALIKILEDAEARAHFGRRNKDLVEQEYTIDRMCERYEELFLDLYRKNHNGQNHIEN